MKKKIYFKIGFSKKIGSGHFYRSINLAKELKSKGVSIYLIINNKINNNLLMKKKDLGVFKKIFFFKSNKKEESFLKKNVIKNLFLDDPQINYKKQLILSKFVKNIILYQDEPKKNFANIIINHNFIENIKSKYNELSNHNTKLLTGIEYFKVNFKRKNTIKKLKNNKIKKITIFFGSLSNHQNIQKVLNYFRNKDLKIRIDCFLGIFNLKTGFLKKNFREVNFLSPMNQKLFLSRLSNSDLFIGSGGTALIESLSLGIPSVAFCTAKNQLNNCKTLSKKKIIIFIKDNNLKIQLDDLLRKENKYKIIKFNTTAISKRIGKMSLSKKLIRYLV